MVMPSSSAALRSLALAALSVGAGTALAQAQNAMGSAPGNGAGPIDRAAPSAGPAPRLEGLPLPPSPASQPLPPVVTLAQPKALSVVDRGQSTATMPLPAPLPTSRRTAGAAPASPVPLASATLPAPGGRTEVGGIAVRETSMAPVSTRRSYLVDQQVKTRVDSSAIIAAPGGSRLRIDATTP
jgi:hypothetical protein